MTLAFNGTFHLSGGSSAGTSTLTTTGLTTTGAGLLGIAISTNGATVTGVSDTLNGSWSNTINSTACIANTSGDIIQFFWVQSSGAMSASVTTTITFNNTGWAYVVFDMFGVTGYNTSTIFDAGGTAGTTGTPVLVNGAGDCVITTATANTMILAMYRCNDPANAGSGFTVFTGGTVEHDFCLTEYQIVSTSQTSLTCGGGTANSANSGIAIAIQAAPVTAAIGSTLILMGVG